MATPISSWRAVSSHQSALNSFSTTGAGNNCFVSDGLSVTWDIKDMKLASANASGIKALNGASIRWGNIDFGATVTTTARFG